MSISRLTGPLLVSGNGPINIASAIDGYNDAPGPSCFAHGVGLADNRFGPFGGGDISTVIPVWYGAGWFCVMDQAPSTLSATNIAAAQVGAVGNMTLATASTGITVLSSALTLFQGSTFPSGCLMIDGNPAVIQLAPSPGGISMYDPRTTSQRALTFTSAGNDSAGTATVTGYDFYGQQLHATVTLSNASTVTTTKTFKAVQQITLAGTLSGSNISVGTADVYGMPLAWYEFPFAWVYWNSALISSSTGFTAAVTTNPSTATTGDVRGTYATQSASNGTKKLQVFIQPEAWNLAVTGLFGITQF